MAFAEAVRRTRMHNTANDTFLFYTDSGKKLLNGLDFLDGKEIKPLEDICRNDIFISCSHEEEDKPHFEEVKKQLESLKYYGVEANVWDNTQISLGDNREKEIAQALKKTRIAVLLVSPKFIASKFINEIELVSFKELVEKEKGKIMPILLRKVPFNLHPFLKKYQFLNADKPMNDITQDEKDGLYVKLIREIEEVYKKDSK
jgi:hypothetical protein